MRAKLTRMTVEIPTIQHKKLKTISSITGISMKSLVILSLNNLEKTEFFQDLKKEKEIYKIIFES